ncbi:DUF885 domain-containing protein [Aquipuribacter nitratireducens]|uniref:DUF885 domain-containing protein n=1 Tax=Aquipuribacter nitratireducens TaxID=650104 RepID=A0ABW0GJX0_9MICO
MTSSGPTAPPATAPTAARGEPTAPDGSRAVRDLAERFVDALTRLDPALATQLGSDPLADGLPDLSPAGADAAEDLRRSTLARLDALEAAGAPDDAAERRCAALLRDRLETAAAEHAAGEHLRDVGVLFSPVQRVRAALLAMPVDDEAAVAAAVHRTSRVPTAFAGYVRSLEAGVAAGLGAGPAQVRDVVAQLDSWAAVAGGRGWFADHLEGLLAGLDAAGRGPSPALRRDAERAGADALAAVRSLRDHLSETYLPAVAATPDPVGRERYLLGARRWTGADLDLEEVYAWGWRELAAVHARMVAVAEEVLPGATPAAAMAHLDAHGPAVDGVEPVRLHLQALMDGAIEDLDGTVFDIEGPVRVVEARIAPPGSAAAPYYTRPSLDFARPGRTWLPTLGRERFPLWDIVSTWYHEGVPGHHLQLAHWTSRARDLSSFQLSVGSVSAATEGWALYAETLMDELGHLRDAGERMGYLNAQALRAVRVVIDIGMHLGLHVPHDQQGLPVVAAGEVLTPEVAGLLLAERTRLPAEFRRSEVVRYLGMPGQAISYKLGERAWLAGRARAAAAASARGGQLDLRAWHAAALDLGPLGLDDLEPELAVLG